MPTAIDAVQNGTPVVCHEIALELAEAHRAGVISKEDATGIFMRCVEGQEA